MARQSKQVRESIIESYLVSQVKQLGIGAEVRKVKWIGRRGAPDRLVMIPPRGVLGGENGGFNGYEKPAQTIWVELKAPGKKPTITQQREHERMRAIGQRVEVVDSFERVDEVLK